MSRCVDCDHTFTAVADLLTHIRVRHGVPEAASTAHRLLAEWCASVGR